jgi:mono/diheme cytochrome c family protein
MSRAIMAPLAAIGVCTLMLTGTARAAQPEPLATGQAVYEHWCAPCHAPGPGHPGTQSLQLKYKGQLPAVLLDRTDLMPVTVSTFVRQGVLLMAPFRKTEITDAELNALSVYVARNFKAERK